MDLEKGNTERANTALKIFYQYGFDKKPRSEQIRFFEYMILTKEEMYFVLRSTRKENEK